MRIISKYKDYYDYLQGINGVDEKLILDRTMYGHLDSIPGKPMKETIFICDYQVDGLWFESKIYF